MPSSGLLSFLPKGTGTTGEVFLLNRRGWWQKGAEVPPSVRCRKEVFEVLI